MECEELLRGRDLPFVVEVDDVRRLEVVQVMLVLLPTPANFVEQLGRLEGGQRRRVFGRDADAVLCQNRFFKMKTTDSIRNQNLNHF